MQKPLLTVIVSVFISWANAQQGNSVTIGKTDTVYSKMLNEKRLIRIHVPESAKKDPKKKYPVVYLLDAEWNFASVASTISFLSSVNGNNFWPEAILVGIVNTHRKRDLTPTHVAGGLWIDSRTADVSGGGETFMAFIENELIPHIDSTYPTTPYRSLIGHSLGGLMVINALLHHKNLFKGYIAIDPSMWWDNQKLLQQVEGTLKTTSYSDISVFLAMAHTQPGEMDTLSLQKDTTSSTLHSRSILKLADYLTAKRPNGLHASFRYYDQETHSSVPLIATYDALHFLFRDYPLVLKDRYYLDPTFDFPSFLRKHFENLTSEYGLTDANGKTLLPPEAVVNNLAYYLFNEKKQFERAEALFAMNLKNYPESFLAYSFLGDLYKAKGDKSQAVASYNKSLSIKETSETRIKLEKAEQMVSH